MYPGDYPRTSRTLSWAVGRKESHHSCRTFSSGSEVTGCFFSKQFGPYILYSRLHLLHFAWLVCCNRPKKNINVQPSLFFKFSISSSSTYATSIHNSFCPDLLILLQFKPLNLEALEHFYSRVSSTHPVGAQETESSRKVPPIFLPLLFSYLWDTFISRDLQILDAGHQWEGRGCNGHWGSNQELHDSSG